MGRVAVIHPDLGVGGAERLIVDASRALKESGHKVNIFTGYHDKKRCFKETRDGTLNTQTIGTWIPRHIMGKFHALLAYLKMIYIAIYVLLFTKHDLILCDQISACIPVLKFFNFRNRRAKIIFYCHFPDQLLTNRDSLAKALYRKPLDLIEEHSTSLADIILVNSKFTSSIVKRTFTSLNKRYLTVLYPCVDVKQFTEFSDNLEADNRYRERLKISDLVGKCIKESNDNLTFLSINRFETKKNLALAIKALSECIAGYEISHKEKEGPIKVRLIIAGGYDNRLNDCITYYNKLQELVKELRLEPYVVFIKSPSDVEKLLLLKSSHVIVYTPEFEHFGIVPLEAMAMSRPVVASASGGPLETIEDGVTGFLCEPDKYAFADAMLKLYSDRELGVRMGKAGIIRAKIHFSYETFRSKLNEICYPYAQPDSYQDWRIN